MKVKLKFILHLGKLLLAFTQQEAHINSRNQLNHTGKDRLRASEFWPFPTWTILYYISFTCHLSQTTGSEE